jgi:hypothetical protein
MLSSFSPHGIRRLTLFAGDSGIVITQLDTLQQIKTPAIPPGVGKVSAIRWLTPKDTAMDGLIYGTTTGFIGLWKQGGRGSSLHFGEGDCSHLWTNTIANQSQRSHSDVDHETGEITWFAYDDTTCLLACSTFTGHLHVFKIKPGLKLDNAWSVFLPRFTPMCVCWLAASKPRAVGPELWVFGLDKNV